MSWDREKYEARCRVCGATGYCIKADDDWGRSSTTWVGFENVAPSADAVGRKRADARDNTGRCACGSSEVEVGKSLGRCDSNGDPF